MSCDNNDDDCVIQNSHHHHYNHTNRETDYHHHHHHQYGDKDGDDAGDSDNGNTTPQAVLNTSCQSIKFTNNKTTAGPRLENTKRLCTEGKFLCTKRDEWVAKSSDVQHLCIQLNMDEDDNDDGQDQQFRFFKEAKNPLLKDIYKKLPSRI